MSVNKVILLGNVGKDPDVRHLDNGVAVASLTLATSDRAYTLQNGTQVPERTEWHNIVAWKGLAEIIEKYVKKGSKIYLEGKIRTRSYEDSNKVKRYITEIFADNIELLDTKREERPIPPEYQQPIQQPNQRTNSQNSNNGNPDLPFQ